MGILHQGKGRFVLGNDFAPWYRPRGCCHSRRRNGGVRTRFRLGTVALATAVVDSTQEPRARRLFSAIRQDLGLVHGEWQTRQALTDLSGDTREILEEELERRIASAAFFQRENPLVRHIVLRKRVRLEEAVC